MSRCSPSPIPSHPIPTRRVSEGRGCEGRGCEGRVSEEHPSDRKGRTSDMLRLAAMVWGLVPRLRFGL